MAKKKAPRKRKTVGDWRQIDPGEEWFNLDLVVSVTQRKGRVFLKFADGRQKEVSVDGPLMMAWLKARGIRLDFITR